MPEILIVKDTVLKARPVASQLLKDDEKTNLRKGTTLSIVEAYPGLNEHWVVFEAKETAPRYIYSNHAKSTETYRLDVPYFRQQDNDRRYHGSGYRQCCLTSNAMLVCYLKPDFIPLAKVRGFDNPEDYYGQLLDEFGDTTDHSANTKLLAKLGIESQWVTNLTPFTVKKYLRKNAPVVAGVAYKQDGHILTITGFSPDGLYVNDPYGVRLGASDAYDTSIDGRNDLYSWDTLYRVLWDLGTSNGHGRIVTGIKH